MKAKAGWSSAMCPIRSRAADEVLIEVEACGVCGSDVQIINIPPGHPSTPPVIIGHEFVGRIRAVGAAVRDPGIGAASCAIPDPKCGACDSLPRRPAGQLHRTSWPSACTATGPWRSFVTAPANSVYPIASRRAGRAGRPGRAPGLCRQRDEPGRAPAGRDRRRVRGRAPSAACSSPSCMPSGAGRIVGVEPSPGGHRWPGRSAPTRWSAPMSGSPAGPS